MAEAYPVSFRVRVVEAYESGTGSYATLAERFVVGTATVKRWVAQQRRDGHVEPKPKAGGTPSPVPGATVEALIAALGDPTAGELTAAYNRHRRGRGRVRLHAWVYQTTRRAIADYYRAPSHTREVPAGAAVDLAPHVAHAADDVADESALQELSTCLKPLISSLGPADREALQLVEFEGVSQVEAAERLGLSVSGMKSRVQRARLHLRSALDECCRIALDRRGGIISYETLTDQCGTCQAPPETSGSESSPSVTRANRPS